LRRLRFKRPSRRQLKRAGILLAGVAMIVCAVTVALWHVFPFPIERLKSWPASPVVRDRTGRVMLSLVSRDGQWRRPVLLSEISPWLVKATVAVEDERFFAHHGVDPLAVARAVGQNIASLRTVSGASTLTMQVCRMMDDRPRTFASKVIEAFRALQLERLCGKDEIIATYLNIAPYGGNLRGVEAASLAYFNKRASDLTLGEAALLAGLPQSPSRYRPERFPDRALARRRKVLQRMSELGMITGEQSEFASAEPIPARRYREPSFASHAAWLALQRRPCGGQTTIDPVVQSDVEAAAKSHAAALPPGTQVAVVVIDVAADQIVALVGSLDPRDPIGGAVNGVLGRRSPGSTLKPFVYAAAMEAGLLDPGTTVFDIPIDRGGWTPSNFDDGYSGALPAADALRKSLNVPAILVAEAVGLPRCLGLIEAAGIRLPPGTHDQAGLAVVVGAAEVTLLDLVNGYATIARKGTRRSPCLFADEQAEAVPAIDADVCAIIDDVLSSRHRRPRGMENRSDTDVPWFMWKTGTSSGRRDSWAVGHNRRYAIGVWIGRFAGGGAVQYVGAEAAEPLLARLFDLPVLRTVEDPPCPTSRPAVHPLPAPRELAGPLRILSPAPAARFVAVDGIAVVHPRANRLDGVDWFLNDRFLERGSADRLVLGPGQYELRCVDGKGGHAASRFVVAGREAMVNP
jgi:penicillin-binding protein 1C